MFMIHDFQFLQDIFEENDNEAKISLQNNMHIIVLKHDYIQISTLFINSKIWQKVYCKLKTEACPGFYHLKDMKHFP